MKLHTIIVFTLLLSVWSVLHTSVHAQEYYISPTGNDNNDGSKSNPFQSIGKSLEAIKTVFRNDPEANCTVWLSEGKYLLRKPEVLNSYDLKSQNGSLTFRALPGESPVVSGGIEVTGWSYDNNGVWTAILPKEYDLESLPRELFLDNSRAIRARHPNKGFLRVDRVGEDRRTNFFFKLGEFPIPADPAGTELILLHDWSISRVAIKTIDPSQGRLTAIDSIGPRQPAFFNMDNWEANPRYFLENDIRFLDADYEWFIDPENRKVSLRLPKEVHPDNLAVVVPYSQGLLLIEGHEKKPLKNIHFEGLTFRHSAWMIPENGYGGIQAGHIDPKPASGAWAVVPAAVYAEWSENISFTKCNFSQLGGAGIWFGMGSRHNRIIDCKLSDISGNGIMIGEGRDREVQGGKWWQTAPEQVALGNLIEGTEVTECGTQFFGAVGIWCGLTAETTIRNNTIHQLPYTGISIGWMWNPTPTPCRNNNIEGNHIHHILQTLSDGGGIYMLGLQPGSKITGNYIHHVHLNAGRAESNGMFLDEGTTDVVVSNNLIHDIAKSPLRFHKATTNLVRRNWLFCNEDILPIRYNNTRENDITKEDNRVFTVGESDYDRELEQAIMNWKRR